MPHARSNGLDIYFESHGDEGAQPILLLMGMGSQLTRWQPSFYQPLVDAGHRIIVFDYRDVGLSDKLDGLGLPDMPAIMSAMRAGQPASPPYGLEDLAADAIGLLDALNVARSHVVGVSMGGMVAQIMATDYPRRILSLTSIMATTADPSLPPSKPEAMAVLTGRPPDPVQDLEGFLDNSVKLARVLGSPGFPTEDGLIRERALRDYRRQFYRPGGARHYAAIMAAADRSEKLKKLDIPVTVVHGADDPLLPVDAGYDTARKIPNAELKVIPGMGHDLPAQLHLNLAAAVLGTIARARASGLA
jgi:pimeloyl-ACP methyl ester carboxylesterase